MHGRLTDEQREVLKGVVRDQVVHDLGAGSCELARELLKMGAQKVIAVDRRLPRSLPEHSEPVVVNGCSVRPHFVQSYFHEMDPLEDGVAFISWPLQYVRELTRLIAGVDTVVYLGCNTNHSACGPAGFWEHVRRRHLKHHVPHRQNTLLVYGRPLEGLREMVLEERAGLDRSKVYFYDDDPQKECQP